MLGGHWRPRKEALGLGKLGPPEAGPRWLAGDSKPEPPGEEEKGPVPLPPGALVGHGAGPGEGGGPI